MVCDAFCCWRFSLRVAFAFVAFAFFSFVSSAPFTVRLDRFVFPLTRHVGMKNNERKPRSEESVKRQSRVADSYKICDVSGDKKLP